MNRKFLTIFIVSVFLITSLGVISAADESDSISVKIQWDDNVNVKPDYVTVNLIKDGKIVDSAKLNENNFWKFDFNISDDGNYNVKEVISSDYSTTVKGNAEDGFVIKTKLVEDEVLGASGDDTPLQETSGDEVLAVNNSAVAVNASNGTAVGDTNSTGNNTNDTSDANSTAAGDDSDNSNDDDSDEEPTTTTTTTTKIITKKVPKEVKKKPADTKKLKQTGFPLVVLVVAVFVAVFVPFSRKK